MEFDILDREQGICTWTILEYRINNMKPYKNSKRILNL